VALTFEIQQVLEVVEL